jgi:hypothetical protein
MFLLFDLINNFPASRGLPGADTNRLKELKARAFTCYARKNEKEAEVLYREVLGVILSLNNGNKADPEFVTGIKNVNKCREKIGLQLLDEFGEETEDIEEW